MPVNSTNPEYELFDDMWLKCRDAVQGEEKVKSRGTRYLPQLTGQDTDEYNAYKKRAFFYNATSRTLDAMSGAVMRKPPVIEFPKQDRLKKITDKGNSIQMFSKNVLEELLTTGRAGILVDMPMEGDAATNECYLSYYRAEDVINWKTEFMDGEERLIMVVLKEYYDKEKDDFETEKKERIRVLLLEDSTYFQRIYLKSEGRDDKNDWILDEEIVPKRKGATLDFIPFILANHKEITTEIIKPPLLDLVNINLSHYRSAADLEHGRHFTALPTAVFSGFPESNTYRIGSSIAYVSEDPAAKAFFLEYTGQGLGSLEKALEQKEYMMAIIGTRLLDVPKKGVEAAETYKMRNLGETNILTSISTVLGDIVTQCLRIVEYWEGTGTELNMNILATFNLDFDATMLDSNQITALVKAYQSGAISWETLFYNLKRGDLIPQDIDEEEEQARIEENMTLVNPAPNEPPPEEDTENKGDNKGDNQEPPPEEEGTK